MQQVDDAQVLADEMRRRCLGSRVTRLHRLLSLRYDQALAEAGLTLPQAEILSALMSWQRPVRPAEMGRTLVVSRSAMSRKLAALEDRGMVETAERSDSGRSMGFAITAKGIQALAGALDAWRRVQEQTEDQLGPDAAPQVEAWLMQLDDE